MSVVMIAVTVHNNYFCLSLGELFSCMAARAYSKNSASSKSSFSRHVSLVRFSLIFLKIWHNSAIFKLCFD